MESGIDSDKRPARVSDSELLRRIGHDLRSLYAEVIQRPLPPNIEVALSRIDREQTRARSQSPQIAL